MPFYEHMMMLDGLKTRERPSRAELEEVQSIIAGGEELARYFYGENERGSLSVGWLELLDGAGEFDALGKEDAGIVEKFKAHYLVDCAEERPEEVVTIIEKIDAKDAVIQGMLGDALAKMGKLPPPVMLPTAPESSPSLRMPRARQMLSVGERYEDENTALTSSSRPSPPPEGPGPSGPSIA